MDLKKLKINFKQPKYILPAILFLPVLGVAWLFVDLFSFEKKEVDNRVATEYINPDMPEAIYRGDGIGKKHENMRNVYGNIKDFTAVNNTGSDSILAGESYDSKYTEEDLRILEQQATEAMMAQEAADTKRKADEALAAAEAAKADKYDPFDEARRKAEARRAQQAELDELTAALEEITRTSAPRRTQSAGTDDEDDSMDPLAELEASLSTANTREVPRPRGDGAKVQQEAVMELDENDQGTAVTKASPEKSSHFNTLVDNDPQPKLIKAIIDEDIKAVDGSRVRLRLLDDVVIDGLTLRRGTCLYATMSGFGSQRVKGSVKSVLIDDNLKRISLNLYDMDGLEGLYVPASDFRETAKNIASGSMNGSTLSSMGGYNNSMAQWGMQAVQNAISQTTSAISKSIRKNRVKLKYGTQVYLVNGRQNNNN